MVNVKGCRVSEQKDILSSIVKLVATGEMLLHDDRQNLISKEDLVKALSSNKLHTEIEIRDFISNKLIIPVDENDRDKFHATITLDFLNFNHELELLGYPLKIRQKIAEMYYSLFWSLSSDVDSEIALYKEEQGGRELSQLERAYIRVISEWAVADTVRKIEERILRLEPEGGIELERLIAEIAKKKKRLNKNADFGFQEIEIEKVIKEIWLPPFRYFHGREIKAFLDINSWEWTKEENRLLWGGHFDFALCDSGAFLRLVIEYNGTGHYGRTPQDLLYAQSRDETKRNICAKAGIPIISLTPEFAFVDEYREIMKNLLLIFRTSQSNIDPQCLRTHISEMIYSVEKNQDELSPSHIRHISDLESKLDAFTIQKRSDMLLSLLWEVCFSLDKRSELANILSRIR
jgi:hypothetical protein